MSTRERDKAERRKGATLVPKDTRVQLKRKPGRKEETPREMTVTQLSKKVKENGSYDTSAETRVRQG